MKEPPSVESLHNRLNHVENEISILLSKRPSEERRIVKLDTRYEDPSEAFQKVWGSINCTNLPDFCITIMLKYKDKTTPGWQPTGPTEQEHPLVDPGFCQCRKGGVVF